MAVSLHHSSTSPELGHNRHSINIHEISQYSLTNRSMSCWISCNVCCKHNGRLCMINWQLTMEFLSTERDGAFWVLSRLLWLLLELRVSRFRNNAGGIGECLTPCWSAPPFPLCSLLCALAFAAAASDLAVKIVFPLSWPTGFSVWLTSFSFSEQNI